MKEVLKPVVTAFDNLINEFNLDTNVQAWERYLVFYDYLKPNDSQKHCQPSENKGKSKEE